MGDYRAEIKIEASINGIKDTMHMSWVNYNHWNCDCGTDRRVAEFFSRLYEKAEEQHEKINQKAEKKEEEEREKTELKRLKDKYEKPVNK